MRPLLARTSSLVLLALVAAAAPAPPAAAGAADADAEVVSERILVAVDARGTAREDVTRTLRILNEAGIRHATFALGMYPFTKLDLVQGHLRLPDGKRVALEPSDVVERPMLDEAVARELKVLQVSFPKASAGSTVEVSYRRTLESLIYLDDWIYRGDLPIRQSTYTLSFPPAREVRWRASSPDAPAPRVSDGPEGRTVVFEVRDAAPIVDEPLAPSAQELFGRVEFAGATRYGAVALDGTTWADVASFYGRLADGHYELDPALQAEIRAAAKKQGTPRAVLEELYARLRRFHYVQVYLGMGAYQPHAAAWTWKRRHGDCKDLATVFVAMAQAAGVEAYPMLTRVRDHDSFADDFPTPQGFDHCVAYVPTREGPLVIDATAPYHPLGVVPRALGGAPGLVVRAGGKGERITLPETSPGSHRIETELQLEPSAVGGLGGRLQATMTGEYLAIGRLLRESGRRRLEREAVELLVPDARPQAQVSELEFEDRGESMVVSGRFETLASLPRAGGRTLVSLATLIEDQRVAAFGAASRVHPVELGQVGESTLRARLPMEAGALCPAAVDLEGPCARLRTACTAGNGEAVLERTLTLSCPRLPAARYAEARPFWHQVLRADRAAASAGGAM